MLEFLRRYAEALAGFTELPRERAERIVADLAERGGVRVKDVRRAAEDLVQRSSRNRRELVSLISGEIRKQVRALGLATSEDVQDLSRRVKALEAASKPKAAKKPASKPKVPKKAAARPARSAAGGTRAR